MKKIGISTDCLSDLPDSYLLAHNIDIMRFYIHTTNSKFTGKFKDGVEITARNVLEYLEDGGEMPKTRIAVSEEYRVFFQKNLKEYDEIIHIAISSKASLSYHNATESLQLLGEDSERVTVIDSGHLSMGLGLMVLKAVEMRDSGKTAAEIVEAIENMRSMISSSFFVPTANHLYHNGKISKSVKNVCSFFRSNAVFFMKDRKITLKSLQIGNYEKAVLRYVRSELRHTEKIDKKMLIITHAGCPQKIISQILAVIEKKGYFDEVIVNKASATFTCNTGPAMIGLYYVYK
ncbi:MAG: DegV family EDD domain-containing protein [Lachnospiraceae bacterium]|nr:DegV family EDD domain-containing protein [Lachnospiraceae bacterium]